MGVLINYKILLKMKKSENAFSKTEGFKINLDKVKNKDSKNQGFSK